ncbi:MAG: cyclase family protein [Vampirovibrio sp.]|nr:cyclase family protein [Vampirovibrio sp.]
MSLTSSVIDISQSIDATTACFPGTPLFQKQLLQSVADTGVLNLTAFSMNPHIGTHADAPSHVCGNLETSPSIAIGTAPLEPYIGPAQVIDLSPFTHEITVDHIKTKLPPNKPLAPRLLIRTQPTVRPHVFEDEYAYLSPEVAQWFADQGGVLIGLDTHSVDHIHSKTMDAHHALIKAGLVWLENLDLTHAPPGHYTLSALPLKFMELEASPVRAVLLK